MTNTDKKLDLLTDAINKLVNIPVAPVAPVAPVLPIAPILPIDDSRLTRVEVKIDGIKDDIKTLNDGITKQLGDHEIRIRLLEVSVTRIMSYGTALLFAVSIAQFLLSRLWK
jgi:hypothetical protein